MKKHYKLIYTLLTAMLMFAPGLRAQSEVTMMNGDTMYVDACANPTGTIYDDGGGYGNYTNNFNGWVVIEAVSGQTITLQGDYTLESPSYDWIDVWDGAVGQGTLLVDHVGYSGSIDVVATSGMLTLYFRTDGSVNYAGFALNWSVEGGGSACTVNASGLSVSSITTSSATLDWSGDAAEYNIYLDGYNILTTSGTSHTLTGLTANMEHTVTVAPTETDATRCCATSKRFRTLCGTTGLPYVDGFESSTIGQMAECWTKITNFDDPSTQPQVVSAPGSHLALMLSCGPNAAGGHFGLVTGPMIRNDAEDPGSTGGGTGGPWHVSFRLRSTHYGTPIVVGLCDSTSPVYQLYGFVPMDTITVYSYDDWSEYEYDWSLPEGACRVAFYMLRSMENGDMRMVYIDDVKVERCGVRNVSCFHTDSTSTILQWDSFGSGSLTLGVRHSDMVNDAITIEGATSPYLLTGLDPNTSYTVVFYSDCGDCNGLIQSIRFSTLNVEEELSCFTLQEEPHSSFTVLNSTSYNLDSWIDHTQGDSTVIIGPRMGSLAGRQIYVQFTAYYSTVEVGTLQYPDDPHSFTPLYTIGNSEYYNEQYVLVTVPETTTDHYAAVRFSPYHLALRDFRVGDCLVDSLRVFKTRGTSITLQWHSMGDDDTVYVEYGPHGFEPGEGSDTLFIGAGRGRIGDLQTSTNYDFYVYRLCDTNSCNHQKINATTSQYDYSMPFCEDFENTYLDYSTWNPLYTFNSYPMIGNEYFYSDYFSALRFGSYGFDWGYYTEVRLPDIELMAPATLSFHATNYAPGGYFLIGFTNTDWFDTVELAADGSRHHYVVPIPSENIEGNGQLKMRYSHTSEYHMYRCYVDEVQVASAGYENLALNYVGHDSVVAVMGTVGTPADSTVMLVPYNGNDTVYGQYVADSNHWLFTGLDSGICYYCYVQLGEGECISLANIIYTPTTGSNGESECYIFDTLLSYELPEEWLGTGNFEIVDEYLRMGAGAVVFSHPDDIFTDFTLSLSARGTSDSLRLLVCSILDTNVPADYGATDGILQLVRSIDTLTVSTEWERLYLHLPTLTNAMFRLCFVALDDSIELDNISFYNCPPLDFTVVENTLVCNAPPGTAPWYYLYLIDSTGTDERNEFITEFPFVVEDLRLDRDYNATWHCTEERDGNCFNSFSFHSGGSIKMPYCEEFEHDEEGNDGVPAEWSFIYSHDGDFPHIDPYDGSLIIGSSDHWDRYQYVVLPRVATEGMVHMTVQYRADYMYPFEIGTVNSASDTSTFTPFNSMTSPNYSNKIEMTVPHIGDRHLAIRTYGHHFKLVRVAVNQTPAISVRLVDSRTLELTADYDTSYYLNYNTGYSYTNTILIDSTPYLLRLDESINNVTLETALDSNGTNCGSNGVYYQLSNRMSIPYCVGFNYGWDNWYLRKHYRYYNPSYEYYDGQNMQFRTYYDVDELQFLVLPDMNVDSIRRLSLRFRTLSTSPGDMLEVGVMTDAYDTTTFVAVDTAYNPQSYTWNMHTLSLANYSGDGRWITFRHRGPTPNAYYSNEYLYMDDLVVDSCFASLATTELYEWNTIVVDNPDGGPGFYAEYGPVGFSQGNGAVVRIDSIPTYLTLSPSSEYHFYFYCDSLGNSCVPAQYVHTISAPFEVPACLDFEDIAAGLLYNDWSNNGIQSYVSGAYSHSGTRSLQIGNTVATPYIYVDSLQQVAISFYLYSTNPDDRLVVGCMSDPYDVSSFSVLRTITPHQGEWTLQNISFADAPADAHFIAFRRLTDYHYYEQTVYIDDLDIVTCGSFGLHMANLEDDNVTLDWDQVGQPTTTVTVLQGDLPMAVIHPAGPPLNISPLIPGLGYTFIFNSTCSDGTSQCSSPYNDTLEIVAAATGGACINPTDLSSNNAVFYSGTYSNPYSSSGAIDFGSQSIDSRHTVCYDTAARDPRTGNLLRMVPEGATASVRLGNWGSNLYEPEAEGITYSLFVDTMSFNLLIMRYAAVLQDPMHAAEDQPRFRLELLDSSFNLIDPLCASADFVADRSLGWNEAEDNVLWKDWTTYGVDLSSYADQTVYVRLTTYDCNEGSHYGYAYFTLECMRRNIVTESCGDVDSNTLTAPLGFNYSWYTSQSPEVFSTEQTITANIPNVTYYCDVASQENDACRFTLSVYNGTRYPLAAFDTAVTVRNCGFDVVFTNNSAVSADGITPLESGEPCETSYWDFGNGETSTNYHGTMHYDTPGIYTVTLVSGIAGDACTDTAVMVLNLVLPPYNPRIEGPDEICAGTTAELQIYDASTLDPLWSDGHRSVTPATDFLATALSTDPNGCVHNLQHNIVVHPSYYFLDTLWLCATQLPFTYADTVYEVGTTEAVYNLNLQTTYGCDSIYSLHLTVSSASENIFYDTTLASICDNQSWSYRGNDYTEAGTYNEHHLNEQGLCDSLFTLMLDVRPTSATDTFAVECDTFTWFSNFFDATPAEPLPQVTLQSSLLCDSTVTLHLTVNHSTSSELTHTIVENQLPYTFSPTGSSGFTFYSDTLGCHLVIPNAVECDSNITFNLIVFRNQDTAIDSTVCENFLPLEWNGVLFTGAGTDSTILPAHTGADSLVSMTLHVLVNTTGSVADTLVQNGLPAYTPPLPVTVDCDTLQLMADPNPLVTVIDSIVIIPNAAGCDSLVHYTLSVYHNYITYDTIYPCRHEMPVVYLGDTLATDSNEAHYQWTLRSVNGTDSTVRLTVIVHPDYELNDTLVFCPSQQYLYEGVNYGGPAEFDAPHLTQYGCDSLVHVVLMPRDTNFHLDIFYSYNGSDWHRPDTVIGVCAPETLYLRDTTPTATSRHWYIATPDTLVTSTEAAFSWLFLHGSDTVDVLAGVVVNSGNECLDTLVWPVAVFARPVAEFTWDPELPANHNPEVQFYNLSVLYGDPLPSPVAHDSAYIYQTELPPTDGLYYLWHIADDTTSEYSPFYHWGEPNQNMEGEYEVSLVAYWPHTSGPYMLPTDGWTLGLPPDSLLIDFALTCTDTAIHTVIITNDYLQFPNLVTPNGDGINDIWEVVGLVEYGNYPMNELWIYDRTGAQVYHVRNIRQRSQFWDPAATNSPDGTYYYRFSAKGQYGLVRRNGLIEVIR